MKIAPIAQLDRAFDYESKGHRFESCWVHHEKPLTSFAPLRVFLCLYQKPKFYTSVQLVDISKLDLNNKIKKFSYSFICEKGYSPSFGGE